MGPLGRFQLKRLRHCLVLLLLVVAVLAAFSHLLDIATSDNAPPLVFVVGGRGEASLKGQHCTASSQGGKSQQACEGLQEASATSSPRRLALCLAGFGLASLAGLVRMSPANAEEKSNPNMSLNDIRIATYQGYASNMINSIDWFLFEVRPLVFPKKAFTDKECEAMGDACPDIANLGKIGQFYEQQGAARAGSLVISQMERTFFSPMRIMATSDTFDPDTSNDLQTDAISFEVQSARANRAAKNGDVAETRKYWEQSRVTLNNFLKTVNESTGLPETSSYYLPLIPADDETLGSDYWERRRKRYKVKKKVDAMSKGNKTARFYAKSMFGEEAESWDVRGDRAPDYWE